MMSARVFRCLFFNFFPTRRSSSPQYLLFAVHGKTRCRPSPTSACPTIASGRSRHDGRVGRRKETATALPMRARRRNRRAADGIGSRRLPVGPGGFFVEEAQLLRLLFGLGVAAEIAQE